MVAGAERFRRGEVTFAFTGKIAKITIETK
jgi:hypothetical protein